jgi:hypothetical protein
MNDLIIIRCPYSGFNVQTPFRRLAEKESGERIEAFECPACSRVHWIDKASGRALGDEK